VLATEKFNALLKSYVGKYKMLGKFLKKTSDESEVSKEAIFCYICKINFSKFKNC
jgi:hypothetical protein